MNDITKKWEHRSLCQQRDKEFLALYNPTLDALLEKGVAESKARRAAVDFTIANGRPHYHVDHDRAYRVVCSLLAAEQKKAPNATTLRTPDEMALPKSRLRQQMWYEIAGRVSSLCDKGLSVECAINHVLDHCRASRFFISPATALTKICPQARRRAFRL